METFVGDIIRIILETNIVLTGLSTGIKYKKPDGTLGQWAATIDPSDSSKMYYDTVINELDQSGMWQLQAFAHLGVTDRGHGKIVELKVIDPLTVREGITTPAPTTPTPTTTPL